MAEQLTSSFDGNRFCVSVPPYIRSTPEGIENYILNFWINVCQLKSASILKKRLSWDVYLISKGFWGHYSIGFVRPGKPDKCFVIHLMVSRGNTSQFVLDMIDLQALSRTAKYKDLKVTKLGDVSDISAKTIFLEGYDCFTTMGNYHAVLNNCQHYCQKLAEKFHLNQPVMIGNDAVAVGGAVILVMGLVSFALYELFVDHDDESDDTTDDDSH